MGENLEQVHLGDCTDLLGHEEWGHFQDLVLTF